jgi:hypothetical protein
MQMASEDGIGKISPGARNEIFIEGFELSNRLPVCHSEQARTPSRCSKLLADSTSLAGIRRRKLAQGMRIFGSGRNYLTANQVSE